MTSARYFQISLLLPIIAGSFGYLVPSLDFFLFIIAIGGIPYIAVAVLFAFLINKARSMRRLVLLSVLAPVVYAIALALFIAIVSRVPEIHLSAVENLRQWFEAAALGARFGAAYVALAWLLWAAFKKARWVRDDFAT